MNREEEEVFVLTRLCHSDVWILSENETVIWEILLCLAGIANKFGISVIFR